MSSGTTSAVNLPTVGEAVTISDQPEIPDVSVTMVTDKSKEEPGETVDSSSTVDDNSHVTISHTQPWSKGMKILLGCKVSHVMSCDAAEWSCTINSRPWGNHTTRQYDRG